MGGAPPPPLVLAPQAPKKCHFFGIFGGSRGVPPGPPEDPRKPRFWAPRDPPFGAPRGPQIGVLGAHFGGSAGPAGRHFCQGPRKGVRRTPGGNAGRGGGAPPLRFEPTAARDSGARRFRRPNRPSRQATRRTLTPPAGKKRGREATTPTEVAAGQDKREQVASVGDMESSLPTTTRAARPLHMAILRTSTQCEIRSIAMSCRRTARSAHTTWRS